jgi:hypothetical protein
MLHVTAIKELDTWLGLTILDSSPRGGNVFYMFVSVTGGSDTMKLPPYLFVYKTHFCSYFECCFHK